MKANKTSGQNFLNSRIILNELVKAASLENGQKVLEVGPGKGSLTKVLLEQGAVVTAVEKDKRLAENLREKFGRYIAEKRLEIIDADVLGLDFREIGLSNHSFKIIANIPYYITGKFIRKILESDIQPVVAVLMLQKEVAKRITANHSGKESLLSLSVKAYSVPKFVKKVSKNFFIPKPKVDSAILLMENISKDFFINIDEKKFFAILKKGFAHKRKLLASNLGLVGENRSIFFNKVGINEKARPEDLALADWRKIYLFLENN